MLIKFFFFLIFCDPSPSLSYHFPCKTQQPSHAYVYVFFYLKHHTQVKQEFYHAPKSYILPIYVRSILLLLQFYYAIYNLLCLTNTLLVVCVCKYRTQRSRSTYIQQNCETFTIMPDEDVVVSITLSLESLSNQSPS